MARQVSNNGLQFSGAWEKFRSGPYHATAKERELGIFTWGFGHTGKRPPGTNVTRAEALLILSADMRSAALEVEAADLTRSLNQAQFDAMTDLVFNVGPRCIASTTGTGQALRRGDIRTLQAKLPQFINQAGKPELGLKRRAIGRLALFNGASWQVAENTGRAVASL